MGITRTHAFAAGVLSLVAVTATACAGSGPAASGTPTSAATSTAPAPSASPAASASPADAMFAQMMIPHHEQAVVMSTLAETRASNPEIQALAAQIKMSQQTEIAQMTSWLAQWGVPTIAADDAMGMHAAHGMSGMLTDEQLTQLESTTGPEFDRLFATYMIEHHLGAVDMAGLVANSPHPEVSALAQAIIASQEAEIGQMQQFLNSAGPFPK